MREISVSGRRARSGLVEKLGGGDLSAMGVGARRSGGTSGDGDELGVAARGNAKKAGRGGDGVGDISFSGGGARRVGVRRVEMDGPLEDYSDRPIEHISDVRKWMGEFFAKPFPASQGEFETTQEFRTRLADYTDLNRIYSVDFAKSVERSKSYRYDADTETVTVLGGRFIDNNRIVLDQKATALGISACSLLLDSDKVLRLRILWSDLLRQGDILDGSGNLSIDINMAREQAKTDAQHLRIRIGFKVRDVSSCLPRDHGLLHDEEQSLQLINNENGRAVSADILFFEIFNVKTGETLKRFWVKGTASRQEANSPKGNDVNDGSPISTRNGDVELAGDGRRGKGSRDGEVADGGNTGRAPRAARDARPLSDPNPKLTDEMKGRKLNARIVVNVEVDVDGSHTESIVTGSGDDEVDELILKTMRRWRWANAIMDGEPKKQAVRYRFTIDVK